VSEFAEWESFYVIVGAAAGALIGLQFVVITLIAENPPPRAAEASATFNTPTIMHFSAALLLSALVSVPWDGITIVADLWGLLGVSGVVYAAIIARRMRAQQAYRPVLEDWVYHALLPMLAYGTLAVSAFEAASHTRDALFGVAASTLLLLFIGIHIAWDNVSYHVLVYRQRKKE
jgi:hypothetical protein